MRKKIKYTIIIFITIIMLLILSIIFIKYIQSKETVAQVEEPKQQEENVLVIGLEEKTENQTTEEKPVEEQKVEEKNKTQKDASGLTQDIYGMNTEIGTLYIPKTKLNTKVYSNLDPQKMEKMPAFLYTSGGLNQTGITLIVGHNRRNGKMFSNNKKLSEGDIFYFTDYEGNQKEYTIYSKFITTSDDTSFLNEEVNCPTIALSCCTDASDDNRIIILGRAE